MASEPTSNLVDVTFQALHGMLSGQLDAPPPQKLASYLELRSDRFKKCVNPFPAPSAASRSKVESGSVTLADGVKLRIEAADKPFVWAVSKRFMLDEVDALVLLRSFLYNQGLPDSTGSDNLAEELAQAITQFYFTERLSVLRCFIPLLRARENVSDPLHDVATKFVADILKEPSVFIGNLVKEYSRRTQQDLPPDIMQDLPVATAWAKQLAREQLAMLEVIFWLLWDLVPASGPIVVQVFKAGYETDLGRKQLHSSLLLEEEGAQILKDMESLWIVLLVEALNLEKVLDDQEFELLSFPQDESTVLSSPSQLHQIHDLVLGVNDMRYSPITLAWSCILFRLHTSSEAQETIPQNYEDLIHRISFVPESDPPAPLYQHMLMWALHPEVDVLRRLAALVEKSALFVTSIAWSTGSALTEPNAIAFRAIIKGLLIGVCEMCRAEFIPDFAALVDAWVALFGTGEPVSTAPLALQYWSDDWARHERRQPFDIARVRFPVQFRPLVRLLASMARGRDGALYSFHFFNELPTFTHVVALDAAFSRTYDADPDSSGWVAKIPLTLPGGSVIPAGSVARVLGGDSAPGAPIVLKWDHTYSGWTLLRDVLADFARTRAGQVNGRRPYLAPLVAGTLTARDLGIDVSPGEEDDLIVDALTLFLNIVKYEPALIAVLMSTLDAQPLGASAPNIIQLTILIIEEALTRARPLPGAPSPERLITVCLEVLTALLPSYPNRVWPYLKTTTQLFGSDSRSQLGATPPMLAAERVAGHYPMTRALINLVRAMLDDALPRAGAESEAHILDIKEKVLLRALHLLHAEVWLEHTGWRFRELGDRFEIARNIVGLYTDILRSGQSKGTLAEFVLREFLLHASHSSIAPLVAPVVSGGELVAGMYKARRFTEAREMVLLVEALLQFARLVVVSKPDPQVPCLLEHAYFSANGGQRVPVDVVAGYVSSRELGPRIPVEAVKLLTTLSISGAALSQPLALARHLEDPVATAEAMVRIARHPYDELVLRNAVWKFMAVAVDTQPAFAGLFISGSFVIPIPPNPQDDAQEKKADDAKDKPNKLTAVDVARQTTSNWKELWESNPELLSSALGFLDVVWQHALEHKPSLEAARRDPQFAQLLADIALAELGATPASEATSIALVDGEIVSNAHEDVVAHAHRLVAKSRAVHVLALDVNVDPPGVQAKGKGSETHSLRRLLDIFTDETKLRIQLTQAVNNSFNPDLHGALVADIAVVYPALALERIVDEQQREFGDSYLFDLELLRSRLTHDLEGDDFERERAEGLLLRACSVNLNWSLADAQTSLTQAWRRVLQYISRSLRSDGNIATILLSVASQISTDIVIEARNGHVMAVVHTERLGLLLGLLETAWFGEQGADREKDKQSMAALLTDVEGLVTSDVFPPGEPLRDRSVPRYHAALLQIIYICLRQVRRLGGGSHRAFKTEQRLTFKSAFTACAGFVVDALRVALDCADAHAQDVELLVAVFEQCIRPEVELWSAFWLNRCQEANLWRTSLDLFARSNLLGTPEETVVARHVLQLHLALAGVPAAAERLAGESAVAAYCSNSLTPRLAAGAIEAGVERTPAHWIWCTMLAVVTAMLVNTETGVGRIAEDAIGFVQVTGAQLERSLAWCVEDALTPGSLEELERVVAFFWAFARAHAAPGETAGAGAGAAVLRAYAQRALVLLQHLNYAVTHQNHLESLFEPAAARPTRAELVRRFLALVTNVVATLSVITASESVFLRRLGDWPVEGNVFIVPNINKTHRAPASFGTLFETTNCTLDILRDGKSDAALAAGAIQAAETVLTFACAQLGLWVARKDLDPDCVPAETMRELKSDLLELLANAKRVLEKSKVDGAPDSALFVVALSRFGAGLV